MASPLAEKVLSLLSAELSREEEISNTRLNQTLRLLAKWRSVLIQNTLIEHEGTVINSGPFQGMNFLAESAEGCHIAKLLGTYEQPLHKHIEALVRQSYARVINVGCAEGYYATGLALRMKGSEIFAYDIDAKARVACAKLSVANQVSERVQVFGELVAEDLTSELLGEAIIFCDIEGAERELLDPSKAPALALADIVVESHECLVPGVTNILKDRFAATHDVVEVEDNGMREITNLPKWFQQLAHLDQLLATWEWRSGPTPWLVMTKK